MWGISGDIASDYSAEIADQLARQLEQVQAIQQMKRQQSDDARAEQYLELQKKQFEVNERDRADKRDKDAAGARDKNNQQGVRRMMQDMIIQRKGPLGMDDKRGLAALQVEEGGAFDPRLLQEPEDPNADMARQLALHQGKRQIDAQFEKPAAPAKPERDPIADYRARKEIDSEFDQQKTFTAKSGLTDARTQMIDKALNTIKQIQGAPGLSGAVGAPSLTQPGSWQRLVGMNPASGSQAADAQSFIEALQSQLTLPELEKMRGLGAMSDREFRTLSAGATALNTRMGDDTFVDELGRLEKALNEMKGGASAGGGGATVKMKAPDGSVRDVPADKVDFFKSRGAVVVP